MAKGKEDLLMDSTEGEIKFFVEHIATRFPISKAIVDEDIKFNGSDKTQDKEGTVRLSMESYLKGMKTSGYIK